MNDKVNPPTWLFPIIQKNGLFSGSVGEPDVWLLYLPLDGEVAIDGHLSAKEMRELADYVEWLAENFDTKSDWHDAWLNGEE